MTEKKIFDVTTYGAQSGAHDVQTKAFQNALDACHNAGGGRVEVPAGVYTIGSIRLYSHTELHLFSGVVIKGSPLLSDYQTFGEQTNIRYLHDDYFVQAWHLPSYYFHALIAAYNETDITISADPGAIIDGQDLVDPNGEEKFRGPMGMVFSNVTNLTLNGYTIQHTANWSHTIESCKNVNIDHITILAGHDGLDLHHSTDISVKDCILQTGDDCFAGYDIINLKAVNCILNSACNDLRIGGENLAFDRCLFSGPGRYPHRSEGTTDTHAMFKYYAADADVIRTDGSQISISHSIMMESRNWLTYDFGNKVIMQNGRPLRSLTLSSNIVGKIEHTSKFLGNGEAVTLTLSACEITPPTTEPLLEIDDDVTLKFEGVTLTAPTSIIRSGKKIRLQGYIKSLKISEEEQQ